MTTPRRPSYRSAFQVAPEWIAALDDTGLNRLMQELLRGQAYRCGVPINEIQLNTQKSAPDDGCDAWSPTSAGDRWLGTANTCWQFKAGSAGQPARLAREVRKQIPRETLAAGGRFVVVASGSTSGKKGEDARRDKLRDEARAAGIPSGSIDVIGSERLALWCNEHPAVAGRLAGLPDGIVSLDDWLRSKEHEVPWQATPEVEQQMEKRRRELDFPTASVHHLHIQGKPGVGKSRFAMELCRVAQWRGEVVYIRQASDFSLTQLVDSVASTPGTRLVVVVDEAQADQLLPLRDSVERNQDRIRVITVGHDDTPDPRRIPAVAVKPLGQAAMSEVVKGWYPAMPPEHVGFVVRFADGYVRLARLTADAVAKDPSISVRGLLDLSHVQHFLDRMLGTGDRRCLHVVAVLTTVGWTGDRQAEGESIARHFGLDWNNVCVGVQDFDRRMGIARRGGRYRYISPTPLGIYLALDAWRAYPDLLKTLPSVLPSDASREAYYERVRTVASNPQTQKFARDELAFFFRVDDFVEPRAARRWSALSSADPEMAARSILGALSRATAEERCRIADDARRTVVQSLVRFAWRSEAFHDAAVALALLAEAENETWANNATAEFVARFQVHLGGTALHYVDRLTVLDELVATGRPELLRLAIMALARVGEERAVRAGCEPASDELPEREWWPQTTQERVDCVEQAVKRLTEIAGKGLSDLQDVLAKAANDLGNLLRARPVRTVVSEFLNAVRSAYPDLREPLRRVIARVLHRERKYWNTLTPVDVSELEALHRRFEDESIGGRPRQQVGESSWGDSTPFELTPLATELLKDTATLAAQWPWLTSGEAADGWRLGVALADQDVEGKLEDLLPAFDRRGDDLRVLCGYVHRRRDSKGPDWFDGWLSRQLERDPGDMRLLFEVAWRCGATPNTARRIVAELRARDVDPSIAGQLGYGRWGEDLPVDILMEVLSAMNDRGHRETAVAVLARRLDAKPDELEQWASLALHLVSSADLICSRGMVNYGWNEVATKLIDRNPREIAAAIIHAHAERRTGTWFAEFSEAGGILAICAERDPKGTWDVLAPYLSTPTSAHSLSIGFPRGIMDRMPAREVDQWIAEDARQRARIVALYANKDFSSDSSLASRVIGSYGHDERVASAFLGEYLSGTWCGPSSEHWEELARSLDEVAARTALPRLRRWANSSARTLRRMAESEREREEEEHIR
jgi:hypothetical protein